MRKFKILVVEDERIISYEIEVILEHCGYDVFVTSFGEKAIQMASEIKPDLVLMDIQLKDDIDGIQAALKIHNRYDIPIIYITAHPYAEKIGKFLKSESFGVMTKPFDSIELVALISLTIQNHQLVHKKYSKRAKHWGILN